MYLLAFTWWSRFILYSSLFHCCVFHITSTHVGDLIVKDMLFLYKYFPKLCMLMHVSTGRADRLIVIYAGWWFHFWWMNTSCLWLSCHLTLLFLMSYCLFALFFSSLSSLLICLCCFCFSVLPLASLSLSTLSLPLDACSPVIFYFLYLPAISYSLFCSSSLAAFWDALSHKHSAFWMIALIWTCGK